MLILDLWGISFHPVVVVGLGNDLLFNFIVGRCGEPARQIYLNCDSNLANWSDYNCHFRPSKRYGLNIRRLMRLSWSKLFLLQNFMNIDGTTLI